MAEHVETSKRRNVETRVLVRVFLALSMALGLAIGSARAQEAEPGDPPAAPDKTPDETADETPPSLDELLGLEDEGTDEAREAAEREAADELQRRLDEEAIGNVFAEAIDKMSLSAERLDREFDTGLGTQRIQEDIIRKLDQLIEFARQQQSKGGSSSSSSSGQRSPENQPQSPGKQQSSPSPPGSERNQNPSDSNPGDPPARQDGDITRVLEESGEEWGSLPPRIREFMQQGRRAKYSSLYERLTNEYYRRLAEEGSS